MITRADPKDGSLVDVEMLSAPVLVGERARRATCVIYHDITRDPASEAVLRGAGPVEPVAIALLDPEGNVTSWNPAAERLFGYTAEEAIGRDIDDLVAAERRGPSGGAGAYASTG